MKTLIERTDSYAKHYFTLLVSWFTFFVTVNWASLGWLATKLNSSGDDSLKSSSGNPLVEIVAAVFAWLKYFSINYVFYFGLLFLPN